MTSKKKFTVEEIQRRFDNDVERFSNLETGQQATIDAALVLDLVANLTATHVPKGGTVLDLGCGAGNFTIRVLQKTGPLHCYLVDLSFPMLERAEQRVQQTKALSIQTIQKDLRLLEFPEAQFDLILSGAAFHHLREESEWEMVFQNLQQWLKPGGRLYVFDLVIFDDPGIQAIMWKRYGKYLEELKGKEYREHVFAYIEDEDTPRSLPFQLRLLEKSGFASYEVLHRNSVFACYSAIK